MGLTRINFISFLYFSYKRFIDGNSVLQGPHHVAQILIKIGLSVSDNHIFSLLICWRFQSLDRKLSLLSYFSIIGDDRKSPPIQFLVDPPQGVRYKNASINPNPTQKIKSDLCFLDNFISQKYKIKLECNVRYVSNAQ